MKYKLYKGKFAVYSFVIILFLIAAIGAVLLKVEYDNKPGFKKEDSLLNAPYIYSVYTSSRPQIQDKHYYGNPSASVSIIAFLDIPSEASRYFIKEIFPKLKENYIDNGKIKYYPKSYITLEDIKQKNNNFKYSISLKCFNKLDKENSEQIYFDLFSINVEEISLLLKKYDIPINDYNLCVKEKNLDFDELYQEASEIEILGMIGINQRFYIGIAGIDNTILDGIPKYLKFERTIRQHEIRVGS